ncbi:MAG: putative lipid II flippase FtsW [Clostridia bacterium]|nr:putative lipid II flippase FtsW [Clostridia bacterium]
MCIGLIALSSASSYTALISENNSNYYFIRQLAFAVIGVIAMFVISTIDYKLYEKFGYIIFFVALATMLMVFIPGLGSTVKGARRWIDLGFISFQPSELMKPALAIGIAAYISKKNIKPHNILGYIVPVCMILIVCVVMYFQSHMSGAIIMIVIGAVTIFTSGFKLKKRTVILICITVVLAAALFLFTSDYRMERVKAFFNPDLDITGSNWQPTQSLYAIGSGGLFGTGIGQSRQKYLWLPESQNDFVFSIYAEEFGFIGCTVVVALFMLFISRLVSLVLKTKDLFGLMISAGIISMFAFQIIMNIAVVTKLIPTTGMPLPFFSYGGTSLLINLASIGIVLNVTRQRRAS